MEKKSTTFATDLIVLWCNGSTTVFGSVSGGSSPPGTTGSGERSDSVAVFLYAFDKRLQAVVKHYIERSND